MKKILFLLLAPILLLCSGCGSDEVEEMEHSMMDAGPVVNNYNMALKFVTSGGENLVEGVPCVGVSSLPDPKYYKIKTVTKPESPFNGKLLKGMDSEDNQYLKFSHNVVEFIASSPESPYKFSIVYEALFGDSKAHTMETMWVRKNPPIGSDMICTGFKLDGKEYPIKDDESIDEGRIVVIELNRKK